MCANVASTQLKSAYQEISPVVNKLNSELDTLQKRSDTILKIVNLSSNFFVFGVSFLAGVLVGVSVITHPVNSLISIPVGLLAVFSAAWIRDSIVFKRKIIGREAQIAAHIETNNKMKALLSRFSTKIRKAFNINRAYFGVSFLSNRYHLDPIEKVNERYQKINSLFLWFRSFIPHTERQKDEDFRFFL